MEENEVNTTVEDLPEIGVVEDLTTASNGFAAVPGHRREIADLTAVIHACRCHEHARRHPATCPEHPPQGRGVAHGEIDGGGILIPFSSASSRGGFKVNSPSPESTTST